MLDSSQIEQVLRRYEFRAWPHGYTNIYFHANSAKAVLEDVGYSVTRDKASERLAYFVEINDRVTHAGVDAQTLIGFAHDLCNDYRERDMATLVEYVKERQKIEQVLRDSHGIAAQMAADYDAKVQALADDYRAGDWGCESAWPGSGQWFSERNDRDNQKESTPMCDCSERLESLSERVERLERTGKSKDDECIISGMGCVYAGAGDGLNVNTDSGVQWPYNHTFDNVSRWSSVSTTPQVWVDRDKLIAEVRRRSAEWQSVSDLATHVGKKHRAKRSHYIARTLNVLADDIAAGNLFNE